MTGIDSWSPTPATNATADAGAINWAEGQAPSTVNNTARQMLADTRAAFNDLAWFQYSTGDQGAGNIAVPAVYASGTSFTIAGADVTLVYHVGRRVRAVGSGTGTIYGSISITSYSPTTTTVTVVWDSGSLSNETLVISLCQIPVTGVGVPSGAISGTKTNNSAAPGTVGEFISASVGTGAPVSLVSGAAKTIITIALTAGDWDVTAVLGLFGDTGTTISSVSTSLSNATNTLNSTPGYGVDLYPAGAAPFGVLTTLSTSLPVARVTSTTSFNYYLVAGAAFSVGALNGIGILRARRAR